LFLFSLGFSWSGLEMKREDLRCSILSLPCRSGVEKKEKERDREEEMERCSGSSL
jgi:hypothetical protein